MNIEKIKVRVTQSGQTMDVVVLNKRASGLRVEQGHFVDGSCVVRDVPVGA